MAGAVRVSVKLEGVPELETAIKKATKEIREALKADALEPVGRLIANTARLLVPKDRRDLYNMITSVPAPRALSVSVGPRDETVPSRGGDRIHQFPAVYGAILEYTGRPWLRPAANEHASTLTMLARRAVARKVQDLSVSRHV